MSTTVPQILSPRSRDIPPLPLPWPPARRSLALRQMRWRFAYTESAWVTNNIYSAISGPSRIVTPGVGGLPVLLTYPISEVAEHLLGECEHIGNCDRYMHAICRVGIELTLLSVNNVRLDNPPPRRKTGQKGRKRGKEKKKGLSGHP